MEDIYRGPVPRAEYAMLEKWVLHIQKSSPGGAGKLEHESIYWHSFLEAVRGARKEAEEQIKKDETIVGPACETASYNEYTTKLRKCSVTDKAPCEKYTAPITASQEFGWQKVTEFCPRKAKTSSEETLFASEMIRCGVYY